jgi:peptidoglycan/xylan/chitin deacetylase (PgdA/CDA1 family)
MVKKLGLMVLIFTFTVIVTTASLFAKRNERPNKNRNGYIPVLMYHSIKDKSSNEYELNTKMFEKQIKYLYKKGYKSLTVDEYYKIIDEQIEPPKKAVLITFDDGIDDNYSMAYPILKKYDMNAAFFVVANWIDKEGYMTKDEIIDLSENGMDIECHGLDHEWFAEYSYEEQYRIIAEARSKISQILNKEINYFAFPYGNLNESAMTALYDMGFKIGFSSISGLSSKYDNRYCMKRQYISENDSWLDFITKL